MEIPRGKRKERTGIVISDAMDKTIVVKVERRVRHPLYGKEMKMSNTCFVHDEANQAKMGDKVKIIETRPLSRMKRWRLVDVVHSGTAPKSSVDNA